MVKYDLHCHTCWSKTSSGLLDGVSSPSSVVMAGKAKGLDGIAITDHNEIAGALEACKYASKDFEIIPGIEIDTNEGQLIGLGIKKIISSGFSVIRTIEKIHSNQGLAIAPHPFCHRRSSISDQRLLKEMDAIEVFNPKSSQKANKKAKKFASKHSIPAIAGSDAHQASNVGIAYSVCEGNLIKCIKNKKIKAILWKKFGLWDELSLNFKRVWKLIR